MGASQKGLLAPNSLGMEGRQTQRFPSQRWGLFWRVRARPRPGICQCTAVLPLGQTSPEDRAAWVSARKPRDYGTWLMIGPTWAAFNLVSAHIFN